MRIKVTGQKRLRVIGLPKAELGQQINGVTSNPGYDPEFEKAINWMIDYEQQGSSTGPNGYVGGGDNWGTNNPSIKSKEDAKKYYHDNYWSKVKDLPAGLRTRALQLAVNTGDPYGELMVAGSSFKGVDPMSPEQRTATKSQRKDLSPDQFTGDDWKNRQAQVIAAYNANPTEFMKNLDAEQSRYYNIGLNSGNNPQPMKDFHAGYYQGVGKIANDFVKQPTSSNIATTSSNTFNIPPDTDYTQGQNIPTNTNPPIIPNDWPTSNAPAPTVKRDPIRSGMIPNLSGITNPIKDDARRTNGLLNPGTYNPFDVKWGQERVNPEIDITGPMSHKPLDRFGTSSEEGKLYPTRESSIKGGAGMLDTKNLVNPYTGSIHSKPEQSKPRSYREYNSAVPSMITAGMAWGNDLLQNTIGYNDDVEYAKKLGQTNASEPTVKNMYSRGRHVMNVPLGADYAPDMMTPVQFRGRPVSEFTGFPGYGRNIAASKYGGLYKAAEGTAFTESLGMPTLVENPNDYLRNDVPDMKGPELPSYERPQAQQQTQQTQEAPTSMEVESSNEGTGAFAMPLKNIKITSGFGHRTAPKSGASTEHNGIDLAAPLNTPVYSPMDGTVEKIFFNDKGGKQMVVRHSDGSRSGFAHLNNYDVSIGDAITRGQRIALSGNTGNSTGPHLHFTYRNSEGNLVDPSDFLNMGAKNKPMKGISNLDHNNPGNIHIGGFAEGYGARAGRNDAGGKVAIFPDMQTGMTAMEDLIFGNAYNNLTISQARNKWVNGSPTVPTTSTNSIVSAMGGNYRLNQLSGPQRKKLVSEFIKWEDRGVYNNLKTKGLIFKEGGEYELDDNEIQYILANGGQVEYL